MLMSSLLLASLQLVRRSANSDLLCWTVHLPLLDQSYLVTSPLTLFRFLGIHPRKMEALRLTTTSSSAEKPSLTLGPKLLVLLCELSSRSRTFVLELNTSSECSQRTDSENQIHLSLTLLLPSGHSRSLIRLLLQFALKLLAATSRSSGTSLLIMAAIVSLLIILKRRSVALLYGLQPFVVPSRVLPFRSII